MRQKTVVVGVTGCIGAYKAPSVVRGLQKAGLRVRVVMTEHATQLVGPLTFEALTHEPVLVNMFDAASVDPIPHISLASQADLAIVAPCTANTAAKLASGIADDLLTSTMLAMHCPLIIAPAANTHMYENPATQANLDTLRSRGWELVEGGEGYLACGSMGSGRLADPDLIVARALDMLAIKTDLSGLKVLVTAGPTREAIDPVRFITNYSSGKTGYALAAAARDRGAEVTLVAGPTQLDDPEGVRVVHVSSALEMLDACSDAFRDSNIAIFTAAVGDYRPKHAADHKIKKGQDADALARIELVQNPDIIASLAQKKGSCIVVGYAAETENLLENARRKLESKNADFIVANHVAPDTGFGTDSNTVWFVDKKQDLQLPEMGKEQIADLVLDKALSLLEN